MATIAHFVSVTHNASFGLVAFLRMIGTETENYPSPAAILKSTPPPDDAGAATNDRFDWQAAMATADVFAAYFDCLNYAGLVIEGSMFEMLCEHHEDWALVKETPQRSSRPSTGRRRLGCYAP
jgi:hypothetical protein